MATAVIVITDTDDEAGVSIRTTFNAEQDMSAPSDPNSVAHDMAYRIARKAHHFHDQSVCVPAGVTIH